MLFVGSSQVIRGDFSSQPCLCTAFGHHGSVAATRLSTHSTTIIFKPAAKIQHTAGGTHGDESYPD
jgi:hypothetical protein